MSEPLLLTSLLDESPLNTEPFLNYFAAKKAETSGRRRSRAQSVVDDWSSIIREIKGNTKAKRVALFWLEHGLPDQDTYSDEDFAVFTEFYWNLHVHPDGRHSLDVVRKARLDRRYSDTPATVGDLGVSFSEVEKERQIKSEKIAQKVPVKRSASVANARMASVLATPSSKKKGAKGGRVSQPAPSGEDEKASIVHHEESQSKKSKRAETEMSAAESEDESGAALKSATRKSNTKRRQEPESEDEEEGVLEQADDPASSKPKRGRKKVKIEQVDDAEGPVATQTPKKKPKTRKINKSKAHGSTKDIEPKESTKPDSVSSTLTSIPDELNTEKSLQAETDPVQTDAMPSQSALSSLSASPAHSEPAAPTPPKSSGVQAGQPVPDESQEQEDREKGTDLQPAALTEVMIPSVESLPASKTVEPMAKAAELTTEAIELAMDVAETAVELSEPTPEITEPEAVAEAVQSVAEAVPAVADLITPASEIVETESSSTILPQTDNENAPLPPMTELSIEPSLDEVTNEEIPKKRKKRLSDSTPALQGVQAPVNEQRRYKRSKMMGDGEGSIAIQPISEDIEMANPVQDPTSTEEAPIKKKSLRSQRRAKPSSEEPYDLAQQMNNAFGNNQHLNSGVDNDESNLLGRKPPQQETQPQPKKGTCASSRSQSHVALPPPMCSTDGQAEVVGVKEDVTDEVPAKRSSVSVASPGPSNPSNPFEGNPPIWSASRQEVCETFPQFRSYQGGVYFNRNIVKGYLLSGFGSSRDAFLHGGKLIISHGGGKSESVVATRGQRPTMRAVGDQRSDDSSVRCLYQNYRQGIPLVLLADDKYTKLPYNMSERGIGYAVLGYYVIQHVWSEQERIVDSTGAVNLVVRYKFAFQWCDSQGEPWWTRPLSETLDVLRQESEESVEAPVKIVTVSQQESKPQNPPGLYQPCGVCLKESPQVYSAGWVCMNPSCDSFWEVSPKQPFPHDQSLEYNPMFVQLLKAHPLISPSFPIPEKPPIDRWGTTLLCSRGFHCRQCGRLSSRWKWQNWECSNSACKNIFPVKFQIHHETDLRTPVQIRGDYRIPASSGVKIGSLKTINCEGFKLHYQTFDFPSGGRVHQIRFKRHTVTTEPDEIFREYQEQAIDGSLPFRRWPLRTHKLKGSLLTNYFSQNCGEPYQYVGATENTIPFDVSPSAVIRARDYLTKCIKIAVNLDVEFNEVLSAAYMQEQRMAYHSDDEKGLQPVVAGLSLGAPALMHFRYKHKHLPDPKKKGALATYVLRHGDILVMDGAEMQEYYEHTVEPQDFRIAATARTIHAS